MSSPVAISSHAKHGWPGWRSKSRPRCQLSTNRLARGLLLHSGHRPGWSANRIRKSPYYANPCVPTILVTTTAVLLVGLESLSEATLAPAEVVLLRCSTGKQHTTRPRSR